MKYMISGDCGEMGIYEGEDEFDAYCAFMHDAGYLYIDQEIIDDYYTTDLKFKKVG